MKPWLIAGGWALFLAVTGKLADLPRPHIDDLFFIETAVTWSSSGFLDNRAFTEQYREGLVQNRNFGQTPFYPYVIALWVRLLGLGPTSIQSFYLFFMFWGVFSILRLSHSFGVKTVFSLAAATVFFLSLSLFGLRPEIPSLCLFFLGWATLATETKISFFAATGIFGLSTAFYPSGLMFALPVFAYYGWQGFSRGRSSGRLRVWFILINLIFWVFFFAVFFHFLVGGDWQGFFRDYRAAASLQNPGIPFSLNQYRLAWFVGTEGSYFFPKAGFVVVAFMLTATLLFCSRKSLMAKYIALPCLLLGVGVILNAGIVPLKFRLFPACAAIVAGWSLSFFSVVFKSIVIRRLCFLAFMPFFSLTVPAMVYVLIQSPPPAIDLNGLILQLQNKGYTILLDSSAAKFGLGWKLPPKVYDFHTSRSILNPNSELRIHPNSFDKFRDNEIAILNWNDSVSDLAGRRLFAEFGSIKLPVSPHKSDLYFVSRQGSMGSVSNFQPQTMPHLR